MDSVKPSLDYLNPSRHPRLVRWTWIGLGNQTVAEPAFIGELEGKAVHVFGDFGLATVELSGSHVETEPPVLLNDGGGAPLRFTEPGLRNLPDAAYAVPAVLDASPETAITVVIVGRVP